MVRSMRASVSAVWAFASPLFEAVFPVMPAT